METQAEPITEESYDSEFFRYEDFKKRLTQRIGDWASIKSKAQQNRRDRKVDLDIVALRQKGDIEQDATYIPQRVIDSNIVREKSDAMLFLNGSFRLIYFNCLNDPMADTRKLESDVTKGLTYPGWYKVFDKHYDGSALHGWDSLEVIFDMSKPLHVSFEHVGHDKLLFNTKLDDIQDDDFLMREYEVSCLKLESFVKNQNFNQEQVQSLLDKTKSSNKRDNQVFIIYKVYFKFEGIVWITWFSNEGDVRDFLRVPEPLDCGLLIPAPPDPSLSGAVASASTPILEQQQAIPTAPTFIPIPVDKYPIFLHIYKDTEEDPIVDHNGRAFLDAPQQEARTALTTSYVNGHLRASNIYASVDSEDPDAINKIENVTLEPFSILPAKITWHNMPYPDPTTLSGLQYLDTINSQQTGKIASSVSNRKDARKTAEELQQAQGEENKITSIGLANYSDYLRGMFDFTWTIIQSQAVANKILLVQIPGQPDPMGEVTYVNDINIISKIYDVRPAGEVDVLQKEKMTQDMMQDWPVVQMIPGLNQIFLQDFIRLRYPQKADQYIMAMQQGDPGKQVATQLLTVLQGAIQPEELQIMDGQEKQQLKGVMDNAQQYIQNPGI